MTEDEARQWFEDNWTAEARVKLERFLAIVVEENDRQNLIAPSTIATIWNRHALDSAQLLSLAPSAAEGWLDVGSGGGFPGIVVALAFGGTVTMVEPRRKRAEFLQHAAAELGIAAEVIAGKVENVAAKFDVISARAVASVERLAEQARRCAKRDTRWLLPRGTIEPTTLAMLQRRRLVFHVEQSLSNAGSSILVVEGPIA